MAGRGVQPGRVKAPALKIAEGRPRRQPPADAAQAIAEAAARGGSKKAVALQLGISPDILTRWFDERPDLLEAFETGREKERQVLHGKLRDLADQGNVVALLFLLKARHGYREGDQEQPGNRVNINFQIPGAQPLNQFMVIDDANDRTQRLSATPADPA